MSDGRLCDWVGSISEVTLHLTSADSHNHSFTNNKEKTSTTTNEELKHAASAEQSAAGGLLKQANNKREGKQYRDAVQLCSKCLSIDKDSAKALRGRGECWSALGAFQEAIKDYKECQTVAEKTKNEYALSRAPSLMDMYRKTGRFEESISTGANVLKSGLNVDDGSLEEEVERIRYAYHISKCRRRRTRKAIRGCGCKVHALLEMDCGERCGNRAREVFTFAR